MSYNFNEVETSKMSVSEYRVHLLKKASEYKNDFDISDSDLYRARWGIRKFVKEFEKYIGKEVFDYVYIQSLGVWKVFI